MGRIFPSGKVWNRGAAGGVIAGRRVRQREGPAGISAIPQYCPVRPRLQFWCKRGVRPFWFHILVLWDVAKIFILRDIFRLPCVDFPMWDVAHIVIVRDIFRVRSETARTSWLCARSHRKILWNCWVGREIADEGAVV